VTESAAALVLPLGKPWPKHCGESMWFRGGAEPVFYCDCGHKRSPEPHEVRPVVPRPHSTLLRRGVLLCERSVPDRVVHVPDSGICPVHNNGSCPMWFVPWADAERAAKEAGQ
jgi:hypothetical protein